LGRLLVFHKYIGMLPFPLCPACTAHTHLCRSEASFILLSDVCELTIQAYAMDSYNSNVAEMLVIMNLGKQAISFGMGFGLLDWVTEHGYANIVAGAFTAVLCVDTFAVLPFWFFGKKIRKATSVGRLARMHQRSIIDPNMTH